MAQARSGLEMEAAIALERAIRQKRRRATRATCSAVVRREITNNKQGAATKPRTNHSTQTRSLRSRSRIDWAVEAARRVRGGLVAVVM
eukprot:scaffold85669_cov74-Phaeocystis_antarctica.AAC.5